MTIFLNFTYLQKRNQDKELLEFPDFFEDICSPDVWASRFLDISFSPSTSQWHRQDFLLEGQNRTGSGAEPRKFFLDHPSTLALDATNALFITEIKIK